MAAPPVHLSPLLLLLLSFLLLAQPCTSIRPQVVERMSASEQPQSLANSTGSGKRTCPGVVVCRPGILLPVWMPVNPPLGEQAGRALVYFTCLMYIFMGISIIADRFMASIEVITSQEKEVTITKPNGETTVTTVRVWNETVSNLTLMALGSSAPEILLSVIEVCGHNFNAGELGPSTIVGSAAYNMFVIIGLCVWVIPNDESRHIKHLRVFFITAFWSIFAYIWLYLILAVISPGIVEVWEAIVTLLYFPVCVILAWIADRRLLFYKYMHKRYRADKRHGIVVEMEGDLEAKGIDVIMDGKLSDASSCPGNSSSVTVSVQTGNELDQNNDEVVRILKDLKDKHPDKDLDQLIEMANYSSLVHQKKSRAFYRVQATRMLIGAGNILKKHAADHSRRSADQDADKATCSHICFERARYQCTENCGSLSLGVILEGGTGQNTFYVDYCTENGSANAGADYELSKGTLVFKPGESHKEIKVGILDDDVFEEDEHFFVRLQNLRLEEGGNEGAGTPPKGRLVEPLVATVTILDDDHAGIFSFGQRVLRVSESTGTLTVTVVRNSGSRGTVAVPYHTEDGSAKAGVDYEEARGELEFTNEKTSQTLQVRIINVEEYEKQENFFIVLEDPKWLKRGISALLLNQGNPTPEEEEARRIAEMGKPILGEHSRLEVIIEESCEFKNTVDKLLKHTNLAVVLGTHSWREQFIEAVTVSAAIVGDLASHFGCTIGLRDTVTAVVFVALGTSLPDTFASKVAATQDQYADACVGNVTGSNAVNVFLGIGVAWSVAAVYWQVKGKVFRVDPGSLAFSVTLFTIFAFIAMGVLMVRRRPSIGGELGGPRIPRVLTSLFLCGLWFLYILFSSLEAYCHIQGF
ncbi:sodium/calcium exchanger 2a isoform X6 [Etheostoma spectabile]|uniref:sodium/calcium exchanger 2a isoform X6 n=1 Tax=Etheostoma spectabile TaxID=54343 RepID=UPI0013AF3540|nr:sodium/calcium exchanger 3-like isoform X6 [Etheostoma spectabile]